MAIRLLKAMSRALYIKLFNPCLHQGTATAKADGVYCDKCGKLIKKYKIL
jgi:hypothetical protein